MKEDEVYDFLKELFVTLFGRNDITLTPALTAKDVLGWDSFRQVEIALALEERFGIRLRTRDLNKAANVGELVALVVRQSERPA